MSHTTSLKSVVIRDTAALQQAADELSQQGVKCSLIRDAQPRMYYQSQHGKCDYVLRLDNSRYDVGFDKQKDGTYVPVFDEWGSHVAGQIGAACPMPNTPEGRVQHQIGRFMQLYTKHAAINQAVNQGYMVDGVTIDDKGNMQLALLVA